MTKIKFCGLSRIEDIEAANELKPDYVGFVFWDKSKRYIDLQTCAILKKHLSPDIQSVGVFLDESVQKVADILNSGLIDIAQLHGHEDEDFIGSLRSLSDKPVIKAFNISDEKDINNANMSSADFVLLDSKTAGSGNTFDWSFTEKINRPYFLAGGLNIININDALKVSPYAVDVSSGIETDGLKDKKKMKIFANIVRQEG